MPAPNPTLVGRQMVGCEEDHQRSQDTFTCPWGYAGLANSSTLLLILRSLEFDEGSHLQYTTHTGAHTHTHTHRHIF
jgi:hypothetical protein